LAYHTQTDTLHHLLSLCGCVDISLNLIHLEGLFDFKLQSRALLSIYSRIPTFFKGDFFNLGGLSVNSNLKLVLLYS